MSRECNLCLSVIENQRLSGPWGKSVKADKSGYKYRFIYSCGSQPGGADLQRGRKINLRRGKINHISAAQAFRHGIVGHCSVQTEILQNFFTCNYVLSIVFPRGFILMTLVAKVNLSNTLVLFWFADFSLITPLLKNSDEAIQEVDISVG